MTRRQVQVLGLDGVERALKLLGKSIGRRVAHAALKKGAAPIVTEARAKAPKADHEIRKKKKDGSYFTLQPGEGAASIKARVSSGRRGPKDPTVTVGPDQEHFYLRFFESGFTANGAAVAARPFLRPAFDHNAEACVAIVGRELGRRVEIEAAKLAAKQLK